MDSKKLLDAMDYVDPALIEAADAVPAKRKMWHRSAFIAACLCVLLAGTAAAADIAMEFKMTEPVRGSHVDAFGVEQTRTSFEIRGGLAYIPLDTLPDRVWDLIGEEEWSMPVFKGFDSWSQAERFVRLEFADNSVLDQAEKAVHTVGKVYPGRPKLETAHCVLSLSGSLKAPTFVDLNARYYLDPTGAYDAEIEWKGPSDERTTRCPEGWTVIDVKAFIGTEAAYQNGAPWFCLLEGEETMELYTMANGVETIIRQVFGERDDGYYYEALFALNGVRFDIYSANADRQAALDGLKQVLDGFT